MPTPWRTALYKEIAKLELSGKAIDLGGSTKSGYHELIRGNCVIDTANIDRSTGASLSFDLEHLFPIGNDTYDAALAVNVLEHIYDYRHVLEETFRIVKPGGRIAIGVPFIIQYHPSPQDYWRYSQEALRKVLFQAGWTNIEITPLGRGPCTASVQLMSGVMNIAPLRAFLTAWARVADAFLQMLAKRSLREMYPLGYFVIATKSL
ncbi:MAG: methyltransferase domain-containing protein [Patescibacteria group bacterium]|nr:methyltransferase domain-containing protein [Patescibacteria group bacterium]